MGYLYIKMQKKKKKKNTVVIFRCFTNFISNKESSNIFCLFCCQMIVQKNPWLVTILPFECSYHKKAEHSAKGMDISFIFIMSCQMKV